MFHSSWQWLSNPLNVAIHSFAERTELFRVCCSSSLWMSGTALDETSRGLSRGCWFSFACVSVSFCFEIGLRCGSMAAGKKRWPRPPCRVAQCRGRRRKVDRSASWRRRYRPRRADRPLYPPSPPPEIDEKKNKGLSVSVSFSFKKGSSALQRSGSHLTQVMK